MQLSDNARGMGLMTIAMAAFTLNDTAMKLVMERLPLFQAIGLRGLLATAALLVIGWRMGGLRVTLPAQAYAYATGSGDRARARARARVRARARRSSD